jgi:hypothetical protein
MQSIGVKTVGREGSESAFFQVFNSHDLFHLILSFIRRRRCRIHKKCVINLKIKYNERYNVCLFHRKKCVSVDYDQLSNIESIFQYASRSLLLEKIWDGLEQTSLIDPLAKLINTLDVPTTVTKRCWSFNPFRSQWDEMYKSSNFVDTRCSSTELLHQLLPQLPEKLFLLNLLQKNDESIPLSVITKVNEGQKHSSSESSGSSSSSSSESESSGDEANKQQSSSNSNTANLPLSSSASNSQPPSSLQQPLPENKDAIVASLDTSSSQPQILQCTDFFEKVFLYSRVETCSLLLLHSFETPLPHFFLDKILESSVDRIEKLQLFIRWYKHTAEDQTLLPYLRYDWICDNFYKLDIPTLMWIKRNFEITWPKDVTPLVLSFNCFDFDARCDMQHILFIKEHVPHSLNFSIDIQAIGRFLYDEKLFIYLWTNHLDIQSIQDKGWLFNPLCIHCIKNNLSCVFKFLFQQYNDSTIRPYIKADLSALLVYTVRHEQEHMFHMIYETLDLTLNGDISDTCYMEIISRPKFLLYVIESRSSGYSKITWIEKTLQLLQTAIPTLKELVKKQEEESFLSTWI